MTAPMRPFREGDLPSAKRFNKLVVSRNRFEAMTGDGIIQVGKTGAGVVVGLDIATLKLKLGTPEGTGIELGFDLYLSVQATTSGRLSLASKAPGDWRGRLITLRIGTIDDQPRDADAFIWSLPPALGGQFDAARSSHGLRAEVVGQNLAGNELLYSVTGAKIVFDLYVDTDDGHLSIDVTTLTGWTTIRMLIQGTRQRRITDEDTPDFSIE